MITVKVLEAPNFDKELNSIREAIVYQAGMKAIYGNQYTVTIQDKDGYIVPRSEIKKFLANMI